jgi:regulator of sigma E protease
MLDCLFSYFPCDSFFFREALGDTWFLGATPSLLQAWGNRIYSIVAMLLGLGFVIFVHELGHFLAAKMFGVKCEKFYVGFDVPMKFGPIQLPSKLAKFQWGETEYGIGSIPLGGYVKMLGQDDDPRKLKEENERILAEGTAVGETGSGVAGGSEAGGKPRLDPRSYPAKPVFARMIIISAGVIMNLIFGVLMAACAYKFGVPYTPAVLGGTIPGDPAWKAGLQAGDRIVGIENSQDEELSYDEVRKKVAVSGIRSLETPLKISYLRGDERKSIEVAGTMAHADPDERINFQALGILSTATTTLSDQQPFDRVLELEKRSLGDLKPNDRIIGVDGVMLESDQEVGKFMEYQLNELLHPRLAKTVELAVERKEGEKTQTVHVPVTPLPYRSLGVQFEPDQVTVVAQGSVADAAGLRMGDVPVSFNGAPISDAATLPNRVAAMAGQMVTMEFRRANEDKPIPLQWTVPTRFLLENDWMGLGAAGLELPGSGLVFTPSRRVSGVTEGSPAATSGIVAGDILQQVQYGSLSDEQRDYLGKLQLVDWFTNAVPIDNLRNVQWLHARLQVLPVGLPLKVVVERAGKIEVAAASVVEEANVYAADRRFALMPLRDQYLADSWSQALSRGFQEVRRGIGDVLEFLQLIVTGKAFNFIGGPGTIAVQATSAASQGISPLLIFLTLLSANLAVVNFLPVPALDGGHMMFLAAEAITGKPVNEDLQMKLTIGGIIALLGLMLLAFRNDFLLFLGSMWI